MSEGLQGIKYCLLYTSNTLRGVPTSFPCVFPTIHIQTYWNASECLAMADEKDIDGTFVLVGHTCISI